MFRPIRRTVANGSVRAGFFLLPAVAFVLLPIESALPPHHAASAVLKSGQRENRNNVTYLLFEAPLAITPFARQPGIEECFRVKISSPVGSVSRRSGLSL